ncbi:hypothetical protein [uncultured Albimonas sp.]|uniref:hypothetical protein n=1 Tax=uncultured Albimonas sp. TaxID=1331701 RepID=UPI0030EC6B58
MKRAACLLAAGAVWAPAAIPSSAHALDGVGVRLSIIDPAATTRTVAAPQDASDPALRAFATRLLADLERQLGASGARPAQASATLFRIPLVASGDAPYPAPPPPPATEGAACAVASPWIALTVRRDGAGMKVELLALWNERQVLLDLAALESDAPLPETAPQTPLTRSEFSAMAQAWTRESMGGEAPAAGEPPLAERLPPDAARLFAEAPQATRGPFDLGAEATLRAIAARMSEAYADLAAALVARCLTPGETGGRFGGPHDIRTLAGPDFGTAPPE